MTGTSAWRGPSLADDTSRIALTSDEMRFDLVPPGEYQVAIRRGETVVGSVTVVAGVATHYDVDTKTSWPK